MGETSHFSKHLPDIQTTPDTRDVAIKKVGVGRIKIPLSVHEKPNGTHSIQTQLTVGEVALTVYLPPSVKGTHMSRFTEELNKHTAHRKTFSSDDLQELAASMLTVLETSHSYIDVSLDYFMNVLTPETKIRGVAPYKAFLKVEAFSGGQPGDPTSFRVFTGVEVIGKTCCPCSKEISDFDKETGRGQGAHAQRGHVNILVENLPSSMIWFEDLIEIANNSVSSPVYPILKRADERYVTMAAYNNPCFVEDVIRNCAVQLRKLSGISQFWITVENMESIHWNTAIAETHETL
jgi:GTP cyclohydrolase I